MSTAPAILPGCEPLSHPVGGPVGVVVVHGFTGSPSSMRGVADAMIAAGFDVELPRLPGHGTTVDDMLTTGWSDWYGETTRAIDDAAARVDHVVVVGQSMGGALVLAAALDHPGVAGAVCINPVTRRRDPAEMEMLDEFVADGIAVVPGEGSDIADPDIYDVAYDGTPLVPLRSLFRDGIATLTDRFHEGARPLLVLTSRQDHVVDPADSEHLVASWGGPVEHVWLERGYHVATLDFDRQIVIDRATAFAGRFVT